MAEIKTGIFAKNVQKRLNRAQEKVLQKLGKADETKDEQFEQVVINFKRQESEGARLQREMKAYMAAIKGMQQASINLTQSLHEVYEPDWHGKDDIVTIGKDCDALWEDFHNKLVDSTLLNLDGYLQQFPDLKMRVAKRSRKLIDYDSARHQVESLQVTGMKNDRKVMKAEDELKKAQKVFDELNIGLQDELPTLWDRRVGFYISTFKIVTSLEAKFHREISLVCRELYEVMTKLREQHSDKIFTIQGAPSDSGPLRLARTPSPPDDETPPESPDASSNHMLRPISPGPPRPKSPVQGPPHPPPPKATPTKEVAEEQIIDLFGGEFLPAPSPSQPNERPGESLLDLDFDAFQPDDSVSPIPQTAVPWDMWTGNSQAAQPADDAGFVADWSADFGSMSANGDVASAASVPTASETLVDMPEGEQVGTQGGPQCWPHAEGSLPAGDKTTAQESEPSAKEDEVSSWETLTHSNLHPSTAPDVRHETDRVEVDSEHVWQENRRKSTPGLIFINEFGVEIEDNTGERGDKRSRSLDGSGSEYETAEEWADGGQGGGWVSADDELSYENRLPVNIMESQGGAANKEESGRQRDPTSLCRNISETVGQEHNIGLSARADDSDPNALDSQPLAESQGGVGLESDLFAESQGGVGLESDLFAESQGGVGLETDLFAESQGGVEVESDPFAESQGGVGLESDPLAESQGGVGLKSDPFAESQGGVEVESDPFAESQGGVGPKSDPFAESPGGVEVELDPFAEFQRGVGLESDPFAESQGGVGLESDPFAEFQGGVGFESDPFAELQGGAGFESDPFGESQGGVGLESETFTKSHFRDNKGGFGFDPFAGTLGNCGFVDSGNGKSGWDSDPFANSYSTASSGTEEPLSNTLVFSDSHGFNSTVTQPNYICGTAAEGYKEVNKPRNHKEPENSDMSEDEAANRRLGKLYQELDTGKEEDAAAPSFLPDFSKMNEVKSESVEVPEASPKQAADEQNKTDPPSGGEQSGSPSIPVGEYTEHQPVEAKVEEGPAPPAGETRGHEAPPDVKEEKEKPFDNLHEENPATTAGSPEKSEPLEVPQVDETESCGGETAPSEKMPIPSVVIEPASSNEGDDDRDADIISPTMVSDNGVTAQSHILKHMSPSGGGSGFPDDFLYKVETMHDFEAANSDELELKRGDVVLVVPTVSVEDQEAGWLTGIKESDWLNLGVGAKSGLFPENFTQRLE
ncbi:amphiphysin isoform 2-T2 [Fundulus diaphanus]